MPSASVCSTDKAIPRKTHHVSYASDKKHVKAEKRKNATFKGAVDKMYRYTNIRFHGGSREFLAETLKGAIVYLAAQANDLATKTNRKTIMCDHVQTVLDLNNFGKFKFALAD